MFFTNAFCTYYDTVQQETVLHITIFQFQPIIIYSSECIVRKIWTGAIKHNTTSHLTAFWILLSKYPVMRKSVQPIWRLGSLVDEIHQCLIFKWAAVTGGTMIKIQNNAWVTVNNDFFYHEWGDLPMIFTSDKVTNENHKKIASQVNKKLLFTVTNALPYFLHAILCPEQIIPLKKIIDRSFPHCRRRSFLT